eukprot:TRINITY_DN5803_c0_g1_i4.p1 TRINITY_DN5803_c0_g1~~TRINITY_DN5803_c0_g1_i4.p1  ORF type:complete len:908 (+),score=205.79 TRINITY_DN5803_c0_g1_i4:84-2726(+)
MPAWRRKKAKSDIPDGPYIVPVGRSPPLKQATPPSPPPTPPSPPPLQLAPGTLRPTVLERNELRLEAGRAGRWTPTEGSILVRGHWCKIPGDFSYTTWPPKDSTVWVVVHSRDSASKRPRIYTFFQDADFKHTGQQPLPLGTGEVQTCEDAAVAAQIEPFLESQQEQHFREKATELVLGVVKQAAHAAMCSRLPELVIAAAEHACVPLMSGTARIGGRIRSDDTDVVLLFPRSVAEPTQFLNWYFGTIACELRGRVRPMLQHWFGEGVSVSVLPKPGARVPVITLVITSDGLSIEFDLVPLQLQQHDLLFAPVVTANACRPTSHFYMSLQPHVRRSGLSGPVDAHVVLTQCGDDMPRVRAVRRLLKIWAKRKGLYGSKYGLLNGVGCTVLAVRACKLSAPKDSVERVFQSAIESLETTLKYAVRESDGAAAGGRPCAPFTPHGEDAWPYVYYNYQWFRFDASTREPVSVGTEKPADLSDAAARFYSVNAGRPPPAHAHLVTILTPSDPPANCMNGCSYSALAAIYEEARSTAEALSQGKWDAALQPYSFFTSFNRFVRLEVRAHTGEQLDSWAGYVESRMKSVGKCLSDWVGRSDAGKTRLWPQTFRSDDTAVPLNAPGCPGARHGAYLFVGLETPAEDDDKAGADIVKQENSELESKMNEWLSQEWDRAPTASLRRLLESGGRPSIPRTRMSVVTLEQLPSFILHQLIPAEQHEHMLVCPQYKPMRVKSLAGRRGVRLRHLLDGSDDAWAGDGFTDVVACGDTIQVSLDDTTTGEDDEIMVRVAAMCGGVHTFGYMRKQYLECLADDPLDERASSHDLTDSHSGLSDAEHLLELGDFDDEAGVSFDAECPLPLSPHAASEPPTPTHVRSPAALAQLATG